MVGCASDAASAEEERSSRPPELVDELSDVVWVRGGGRRSDSRVSACDRRAEERWRDLNEHGAGLARCRACERLTQRTRDLSRLGRFEDGLVDQPCDLALAQLPGRPRSDAARAARDVDQRHRVQQRLDDARNRKGKARLADRHERAWAAGRAREASRHERGPELARRHDSTEPARAQGLPEV